MLLQPGDKIGYTESINQPTKIRLPDGAEVAITDWSWRTLYSCIDVLSGANDARLDAFSYAQGGNVKASQNIGQNNLRTATEKDTNLDAGEQKMPAEWEYIAYAVAIDIEQYTFVANNVGEAAYTTTGPGQPMPNLPNVKLAQARYNVALEVTQKDFYSNKLGWFSSGVGPFSTVSGGAGGALRTYATNGLQSKDAIDTSPLPVHIGGTETYSVFFQNGDGTALNWLNEAGATDATAVLRFFASLIGLHKRPAA
jgi:hypothetical protein